MKKGLFITFEGGEGSGKSTQAREVFRRLEKLSVPCLLVHEPGSTPLGEKLSRILKWGRANEISPLAELLLFNASRAQLVQKTILPALAEGKIILCDRFADSTLAYQGYGRGLDIGVVNSANRTATGGLKPDITFLLDMPVKDGLARKSVRETNRFEREVTAFHQRVRKGFLELSKVEPRRIIVIDALLGKKAVAGIIWNHVSDRMHR